ncbi:MAG: hypothetical protein Q7U97_13860 [Rhodocyclaceae bacterium]|nr:hypothetical protein [Rhodocyclaceae bacterium]
MKVPAHGIVGREALREAAAQPDLRAVMNLVRAAIDARINTGTPDGSRKWFDIEAFYADRMVIELDGRCWSYPYTIEGTAVTLAEPQEVVETYAAIKEGAPVLLVEGADSGGTVWEAALICAGLSLNGVFYGDALLREAVPLFAGARIFVKADAEHLKGGGKDVRQLVGWVDAPRFVEGATPDSGRIAAMIQLPGLPEETRNLFVEAAKAGRTDLVGLSIDAAGTAKREKRGDKSVRVATKISKVHSVDLIVEPGAGGGLVRLVEAADPNHQETADMAIKERMLEAIKARNPAKAAAIDINTISDEDLETAYCEALAPAPDKGGDKGFATLDDLRMIEARANARVKVAESNLPPAAKEKLRADFEARERFTEADVDAAIKGEREYLALFTESGHVRMAGLDIEITEPRHKVIAGMLDAFFDPAHKDHRHVQSFKECYREITGDERVTGRLENCDPIRLRESLGGAVQFREALDSTSFANALGSSITRRMVADYRDMGQYDVWRQLATVVPVSDFRTQERTRIGGYGDLPAVAQGDPYTALTSPSDEKASYAVGKKGGTESVTLEMIKNDDVGAIRRMPLSLSRSAKRTLAKFVLDFLRTNPTAYDGVALFHATHGNLGAAALDAASLAAGRLAMLKQTEAGSSERLGIGPKYLWVAPDGQEAAVNLFNRNTNLDKTFLQDMALQVIPVWYWTDTNDWCLSADPKDIPTIEIGFLDGNEEPELFVQDMPNVGSMFSNDKVTYKLRHIYGGTVEEVRGLYKAVVP